MNELIERDKEIMGRIAALRPEKCTFDSVRVQELVGMHFVDDLVVFRSLYVTIELSIIKVLTWLLRLR